MQPVGLGVALGISLRAIADSGASFGFAREFQNVVRNMREPVGGFQRMNLCRLPAFEMQIGRV